MKKDYLKDEANTLRVQKHQLNNSINKLSEVDAILSQMSRSADAVKENNQNYINNDEYNNKVFNLSETEYIDSKNEIDAILSQMSKKEKKDLTVIEQIDNIKIDNNMSWEEYLNSIEEYSFKHNLDLIEDPFKSLMTKSQQVNLQKKIKDEFALKNAQCDKYDYMIAGTCGVITGLIDVLFVGAPGDSKLGDIADEQANIITENFAGFLGWDKDKAIEKGSNTTASAIGFLEKKFKINYDHATTHATGETVKNLSLKNHHLKGLGHSPDIIGLFFSVLNQFTNTSSFISNGQIITIETEEFELQGHNFIAKIFCGVANWFGHIMSDWTGSSGTVGQGGRGTGVPIPFYNLFQMINIGEFGQHKQSFATITTKVFEEGYDARHAMAMAVPVLINELLIRFMYTMKLRFYHQKDWKDCIPKDSVPEVRSMLLVGHGVLCLIDGADAYIRSGSGADMVAFLSRTNLIAWTRFGQLALKEVYAWYNSGHIDADAVDEYINNDLKRMLK
ncbi:MAG: hypothetical protein ACQERD_09380 [Campylobacterota bacterium]